MTREIKFRAWDLKLSRFVYINFIDFNSHGEIIGVSIAYDNGNSEYRQDGEDLYLLQYTGLKDKNGKEIYEGDIINVYLAEEYPDEDDGNVEVRKQDAFVCKQQVQWRDEGGYFCDEDTDDFCHCLGDTDELKLEVIGNLYENPELLK